MHLRDIHPKEVYACDICQYATFLNKGNITMHMLTHGNPKVYGCSQCNFTALHDKIMEEHISDTHPDLISGNKLSTAVSVTATDGIATQQKFPKIFLKCSECGFSTDERGVLHDHMISKHFETLKAESLTTSQPRSEFIKLEGDESKTNQSIDTDSSNVTSGTAQREHNSKASMDSSQICKSPSQVGEKLTEKPILVAPDTSVTRDCNSTVTERESDCASNDIGLNQSSNGQPYTYDESNKWYQCTICGYSSEQQRTIKAHIWKHSGHKDLDYPMFQNGPISVYDETPIGVPMLLNGQESMEEALNTTSANDVDRTEKQPIKTEAPDNKGKGISSSLHSNVIYVRVSDEKAIDKKAFESQIPQILRQLKATDGEYHFVQTSGSGVMNEISVKLEKQDAKPGRHMSPKVQNSFSTDNKLMRGSCVADIDEVQNQGISECVQGPLVVEDHHVGLQEEVVESEKENIRREIDMQSKKRKRESTEGSLYPSKKTNIKSENVISANEGVTVQELSQGFAGSPLSVNSSKGDGNLATVPPALDIAAEISVESSYSPIKCMKPAGNSSSDDDSQNSGSFDPSDAEVITLLSLLKKGPNFNPACPVIEQRNSELSSPQDDGDSVCSSHSGNQQRQGISSSLLAVIEQLRERTDTVKGKGQDSQAKSVKPSKKKKQEKQETEQNVLNVEATSDGSFRCLSCFYTHPSFEALKIHMKLHQDRQPFECSLCEYKGKSSEDLQDHMLQHCKLRTYQCKLCDASFNYKSQLRAHMSAHPMSCNKCEYETSNPSEFRAHVKLHENNRKLYVCQKCGVTFQKKEDADAHPPQCVGQFDKVNKSRGKRQYKCEYCPAIAHTQAVLKAHMRTHDVSQSLQCDLCGFLAFSVRSLKSHMKRHVNDQRFVQQPLEQYKCNLCGYVCHHLPSLKSHMWRHASDKNYNYEEINEIINRALDCDGPESEDGNSENPQSVDSEGHLNYLIMFRCCQCGFESVHKSSLNAHMKTHMDIIQKTLEVNQERLVSNKSSMSSVSTANNSSKQVADENKWKGMSAGSVQVHVKE